MTVLVVSDDDRRKYTEQLFVFFEELRTKAKNHPDVESRRSLMIKALDQEWRTLWTCVEMELLRSMFDAHRIANRLQVLIAERPEESPRFERTNVSYCTVVVGSKTCARCGNPIGSQFVCPGSGPASSKE